MSNMLFRISVVLGLIGMGLGIFIGIRQDFSLMPVHAHLNLLGCVVLTALYHRAFPGAAATRLASIQAALAVVGAVLFPIGIACVTLGDRQRYFPIVILGALLVFALMTLFSLVVFHTSSAVQRAHIQPLQTSSINA